MYETEWMKWTKIVFFQQVWFLRQLMSVFKLGLALRVLCGMTCNWNGVKRWMNARCFCLFYLDYQHHGHSGVQNPSLFVCLLGSPLAAANQQLIFLGSTRKLCEWLVRYNLDTARYEPEKSGFSGPLCPIDVKSFHLFICSNGGDLKAIFSGATSSVQKWFV